jgi:hypothetical protein
LNLRLGNEINTSIHPHKDNIRRATLIKCESDADGDLASTQLVIEPSIFNVGSPLEPIENRFPDIIVKLDFQC